MTAADGGDRTEHAVPLDAVDAVVEEWARERPDVDPASIGVFGRITRLHLTERAVVRELHDRHGLTAAAFDVLYNLRRSGPPYRRSTGELAEWALLTSAAITLRIDRLVADGLVRRMRSAEDRRVVYAELTDAGLKKIDEVYEEHIALENRMLGRLTEAERNQLTRLLRKVTFSVAQVQGDGQTLTAEA